MQTLYIDVYFLINFTVDFLSLYFASLFSGVPGNIKRFVLSSVLGALSAALIIFLPEIPIIKMLVSVISLVLCGVIATLPVSLKRRVKFVISFLIFQALTGGIVSYLWHIFDIYLYDALSSSGGAPINRKMLLFSVIVLISIGVFKMIVSFFSNIVGDGSVELEIKYFGKELRCEAFVDSGNLAIDPMDMRPILFIKEDLAEKLFPQNVVRLTDPDSLERDVRRRIRLIPVSRGGVTHVLTGIKVDGVSICRGEYREPISVTIAIDKECGSYGGFSALIPSSVVSGVK